MFTSYSSYQSGSECLDPLISFAYPTIGENKWRSLRLVEAVALLKSLCESRVSTRCGRCANMAKSKETDDVLPSCDPGRYVGTLAVEFTYVELAQYRLSLSTALLRST